MANASILAAFERMWQHVVDALGNKADNSDITDIQTQLSDKANASHIHTIANVTNLQATLDSKAESSHTHTEATTSAAGFMSASDKSKLDDLGLTRVTVSLSTSGWTAFGDEYTQIVTVSGVSATETDQLITVTPKISSQSAYMNAGVYASAQASNSLTFTCSEKPSSTLTVYVVIQEV